MKKTLISSLIIFVSTLSSIQSQLQPPVTRVLNDTQCLNGGKIIKGKLFFKNFINITEVDSAPVNGTCPIGWTLLEPGVIAGNQIITPKGYCLEEGALVAGIAVSIGPVANQDEVLKTNITCKINIGFNGMGLAPGVIVTILDANTPLSDVYVVQDDPLITSLTSFSTVTIKETVCLDSGILIDGLVDQQFSLVNKTLNGLCPSSTAQVNLGVVNDQMGILLDANTCMKTGLMTIGRVLVASMSSIVGLNQTLSSGRVCSIADDVPANATGVVLLPGVILIIPNQLTTKPSTRYYPRGTTKYYNNRDYYNKPYERPAAAVYRPRDDDRYPETYQHYNRYQEDNYYPTDRKRSRTAGKPRKYADEIANKIASKLRNKKKSGRDWNDY